MHPVSSDVASHPSDASRDPHDTVRTFGNRVVDSIALLAATFAAIRSAERDRALSDHGVGRSLVSNVVAFCCGFGLGTCAGMLLAPMSGEQLRHKVGERVHTMSDRFGAWWHAGDEVVAAETPEPAKRKGRHAAGDRGMVS